MIIGPLREFLGSKGPGPPKVQLGGGLWSPSAKGPVGNRWLEGLPAGSLRSSGGMPSSEPLAECPGLPIGEGCGLTGGVL
jgi:hypothetical protein